MWVGDVDSHTFTTHLADRGHTDDRAVGRGDDGSRLKTRGTGRDGLGHSQVQRPDPETRQLDRSGGVRPAVSVPHGSAVVCTDPPHGRAGERDEFRVLRIEFSHSLRLTRPLGRG